MPLQEARWTNFVSYTVDDGTGRTYVGHLDHDEQTITPLAFSSGTPLSNLHEVIEIGYESLIQSTDSISVNSVKILPPLTDRDILAVGKNYSEHAKEFNASGYDASDKVDMPSHPVIFTKRATSIIAHEEEILPHPGFTDTPDYEGEIGVIIGKSGFRIAEENAEEYIWGYTIINDVTAREKQRDHKQFFIGKSADTYCPMGPIAVPKAHLPQNLKVQTRVNGELRQEGSLDDLIFSIPNLIATLSDGQTIQPGDIIATGTPAGVGFGFNPPKFLKPGDIVEISVTGLGTLRNKVANYRSTNAVETRLAKKSAIPSCNIERTLGGVGLITLRSGKKINVQLKGPENPVSNPVVFIHGLGGSATFFTPLFARHKRNTCIVPDLEGHGLSPTSATSELTIDSFAQDLVDLYDYFKINHASIVAHGMGCLIAYTFALRFPGKVNTLILLGPPISPTPVATQEALKRRAAFVRASGMRAVASAVADAATSAKTKEENPLGYTAVLSSLLSQHPEGYAKGCTALAGWKQELKLETFGNPVLVICGEHDAVASPASAAKLGEGNKRVKNVVLPGVGQWYLFEDVQGVIREVERYFG
jgi:2-keto-4-pentenoate hydratase/2-oxohepta-3-ene-1,7-dioic acid hydratase in catechol pathway/pimeloyl-ACP methyl ester carboxylesterase